MNSQAKRVYQESKAIQEQLSILLKMISDETPRQMQPDWHANVSYALREAEKQVDSLLKNLRKVRKLVNTIGVTLCAARMIDKVTTEHCTATPTTKVQYSYPAKRRDDPEAYDTLMEALGIPPQTYCSELVRVHWPEFQEHCNRLLAEGKNPPGGVDHNKTFNEYDFSIHAKKGVLE